MGLSHLPAAMILSKHLFITFLKDSIRLPSVSSRFSKMVLCFRDEELNWDTVSSISTSTSAAILKTRAGKSLVSTQASDFSGRPSQSEWQFQTMILLVNHSHKLKKTIINEYFTRKPGLFLKDTFLIFNVSIVPHGVWVMWFKTWDSQLSFNLLICPSYNSVPVKTGRFLL